MYRLRSEFLRLFYNRKETTYVYIILYNTISWIEFVNDIFS